MKKHLKIFFFFLREEKETRYPKGIEVVNFFSTEKFEVTVKTYGVIVDTYEMDDLDAHFLGKIVNNHLKTKDNVSLNGVFGNIREYDEVLVRGLKEFLCRLGYEIEFIEISREEGIQLNNNFNKNNTFGWTDFRAGYPRYEHQD